MRGRRLGGVPLTRSVVCFLTAHRVRFLTQRCGYAEYLCENCGHPFCFAEGSVLAGSAGAAALGERVTG